MGKHKGKGAANLRRINYARSRSKKEIKLAIISNWEKIMRYFGFVTPKMKINQGSMQGLLSKSLNYRIEDNLKGE